MAIRSSVYSQHESMLYFFQLKISKEQVRIGIWKLVMLHASIKMQCGDSHTTVKLPIRRHCSLCTQDREPKSNVTYPVISCKIMDMASERSKWIHLLH